MSCKRLCKVDLFLIQICVSYHIASSTYPKITNPPKLHNSWFKQCHIGDLIFFHFLFGIF